MGREGERRPGFLYKNVRNLCEMEKGELNSLVHIHLEVISLGAGGSMLGSLGGPSTLWVTPRDHEFLVLLSLTWWPALHRHSINI